MFAKPLIFPDVFLIQPKIFEDKRGCFMESFKDFKINELVNLKINFCQDNQSFSKLGVIRGLHYQLPPYSQSKLVTVIFGKVLDVVVDIRKGSPTFGKYFSIMLDDIKKEILFIPRGFAHGYITLSKTSIFNYKVDNYYDKESEGSITPDDPFLGIDWQLPQSEWIQSKKDQKHPSLEKALLFDYNEDLYS